MAFKTIVSSRNHRWKTEHQEFVSARNLKCLKIIQRIIKQFINGYIVHTLSYQKITKKQSKVTSYVSNQGMEIDFFGLRNDFYVFWIIQHKVPSIRHTCGSLINLFLRNFGVCSHFGDSFTGSWYMQYFGFIVIQFQICAIFRHITWRHRAFIA